MQRFLFNGTLTKKQRGLALVSAARPARPGSEVEAGLRSCHSWTVIGTVHRLESTSFIDESRPVHRLHYVPKGFQS